MRSSWMTGAATTIVLMLAAAPAGAEEPQSGGDAGLINPEAAAHAFPKRGFSPYAGRNYPTHVFWGDQHVHTGWSVDAGAFGATLGPEEALRFARGEQVTSSLGEAVKLSRPLDWVAVTDHSDAAGVIFEVRDGNPDLMADPVIKRWHEMMASGQGVQAASEMIAAQSNNKVPPAMKDPRLAMSIWEKNTSIMEKYNEPGRFTAFIGYEWTSNAGGGNNLHRNVIYRDGKAAADQVLPMTTFDSENPEDLWKWMGAWEAKTGGSLLAIPHNGNLSNGRMFALSTFEGSPLTREWAETRARWEPMYEITQIKGDGETHPSLSPNDEFAGFERWDAANLAGVPKEPGMIEREYGLPVANLGLHAGVGPQACAGFGLTALKSGDTIVVSLEPSMLSGRDTGTGSLATRLAYALDKPEMLHWQSGVGLTSRAADLTKLQPGGSHVITMLSKLALGIPLYRYSADNSLPGGLQVTAERRDFTVNSAITSEEAEISLSPEGESLLREVRQEAKKRGIRVVYVLPSAYSSEQSAAIQRQANSRLLDQVESIMPVLRESEMGVISHRDAFSDSSQHLTFEAANQRSSNFATAIIRYIQSEENCISP